MSSFTAAQLSELNQMFAAVAQQRGFLRVPSGGSAFTPQQRSELMGMILNVVGDAQKGRYPGFGNPQVDTYNYPDNCTASFPWNFDFVIPKNFQRWTAVHLSFKLRAFRMYSSAAAQPAHRHLVFQDNNAHLSMSAFPINAEQYNACQSSGGASLTIYGPQTTSGPIVLADIYTFDTQQPAITLTPGIFQDTSPTSVSIKFDGTDKTSALGGPWTTDTVELDITSVMPTATGQFHTISLTPNQNGRITGELRFSYFVDASVPA